MSACFRSDLALEASELLQSSLKKCELPEGLSVESFDRRGFHFDCVDILDDEAAQIIGKPKGKYYTLSVDRLIERKDEAFSDAVKALAGLIKICINGKSDNVLVAALGNPLITPDALGSSAADNLIVTRHLKKIYPDEFRNFSSVSLCRTGVLGTSGFESSFHISSICESLKPDLVIVIDALAAADFTRLCRTVQICNTGLAPGSGVGNDREALNKDTLGCPVLAIGVPTVIDASMLSSSPAHKGLFVTTRNIDTEISSLGKLIAYSVNYALHDGITLNDIDMLAG